jgi:hypothetical protein
MMTDAECRERLEALVRWELAPSQPDADAIAHALARLALLDDALAALDAMRRAALNSNRGLTAALEMADAVLDRAGKEA